MNVDVILIGNELLIGKIQDTNGKYVIDHTLTLGINVSQITIIPDDIERIMSAIRQSAARKPDVIITSGGLGPTFDDMTLVGVAQAMNPPQQLIENPYAVELIYQSYARRFSKPSDQIQRFLENKYPLYKKMARIPEHGVPLSNSEGAAPGIFIPKEFINGVSALYALPGVPAEFEAIFDMHISPEIKKHTHEGIFHQAGFTFLNLGESRFTELIYEIKDDYPEIWIKTHPHLSVLDGKRRYEVELHLTSFSNLPTVKEQMETLLERLRQHVLSSGGKILRENPLS